MEHSNNTDKSQLLLNPYRARKSDVKRQLVATRNRNQVKNYAMRFCENVEEEAEIRDTQLESTGDRQVL